MKRTFDLVVGIAVMLLLSPVLLVASLAILVTMGRPVMFADARAGRDARTFKMLKFRTMRPLEPGETIPEHDHVRVTRVGRMLRRTSIDELPSLLNIIKGDMSFVGPRPLPIRYVERYSSQQARRLEMRPGLTGLAQASGRNTLTWEERFNLDVEYVDTHTLAGDLAIVWRTIRPVVSGTDIDPDDATAMPEFFGTP